MSQTDYKKEFIKCLSSIDHSKRAYDIFQDFLTVSAISLTNIVLKDNELEKQYFEIIQQYKKPEMLSELFSITVLALEEKFHDFLGEVYMFGNFGNKNNGQFFTPYHISQFMSECVFDKDNILTLIEKQSYITLSEPCCGAGGMILAFAETMLKHDINPQKYMVFQGVDIDINCCRMSFIQTSLYGLTGEIIHGNTISLESWQKFVTPMTLLNLKNYHNFKNQQFTNATKTDNKQEVVQLKLL